MTTTRTLDIALAQFTPVPHDVDANLARMMRTMACCRDADLIVFPELFLGGYTTQRLSSQAIDADSAPLMQLRAHAARYDTAIVFGAAERYRGGVANSAFCIDRAGALAGVYRKTHLFGDELEAFVPGDEWVVVSLDGHRLGLMICFDMEFPEIARALAQAEAEALVTISANMMPFGRDHHLFALARAVENSRPHIYVNQVGRGETLEFTGGSMAISVDGETSACAEMAERLTRTTLELPMKSRVRPDYLALKRGPLEVRSI
ncbi:carbon-nitrogen hydrolase family protein [Salinicola sp. DM10]|uniref:carbon-nitrogen hydrolase family protein n=1 Tax=Salinicola sp. DM10 TaxID=2815721 RepID=UPI001E5732B6|nr:nitrilase-related carbon-nitrogen hydrolase [Salinicola sp. DM10]MCE3028336.1 hypothetical protein [Salinicola sp. DM10]